MRSWLGRLRCCLASNSSRRSVVVLGSTGSVGTQALDIIRAHPDKYHVIGLAAGDTTAEQLRAQAVEFGVADYGIGTEAATELAASGADVVLNAVTGSVGLRPTLAALQAGSTLALANKESLVAGGALVRAALKRPDQIVPVDSEHSAIAQCLRSGAPQEVWRLILTASGGPFRGRRRAQLEHVTAAQALKHPTWAMGPVVTVNSASLINKALELIEAHWLFDIAPNDIVVTVHPQSVVHSMVEFIDGATIAQASPPDMHLPIALGLSWPDRLTDIVKPCDWSTPTAWTFEPLDEVTFPAVNLARQALTSSATHPAVLNAANEVAVTAFLAGKIKFLDIVDSVAQVLAQYDGVPAAEVTVEAVEAAENWARNIASQLLRLE